MIDKREILDTATRVNLNPHVVEKDYVLGWMLAGIYAHEEIADSWLFKGGTCLKKCFFETYRFSEDLDFTLLNADHLDEGFLKRIFAEIGQWVYDQTGIEVPADKHDFEIFQNPRGTNSGQGKISYFGPVTSRSGGWPRIKLDLTVDERVVLDPGRVSIFHPYSDAPEEGIEVLAYDYVEAFAEKFRALAERTRPRDLYDVINLYRNTEARPEPANFLAVLREKCAFKGIDVPRLIDLEPHRNALQVGWSHMLAHQLPALLPVDSFWNTLPEVFGWLEGAVAPLPIVEFPLNTQDEVIRERTITFPIGTASQSHIETIRFAAANRLIVELDYRDKNGQRSTRAIEAYSLRRSQAGEARLMAVREVDAQPRSYLLSGILGVTPTQRTFAPRYPIELTSTGPQSIPYASRTSLAGAVRVPTSRRRSVSKTSSSGPSYVYHCSVCNKKFSHKTMDATLRAHKNSSGHPCYGRYGIFATTKF